MPKYGVYRVENSAHDAPYTELSAHVMLTEEGVYKFRDRFGRTQAAFPTRHFYVIVLEG